MSPNLRRAAHQAIDILFDALAEEMVPAQKKARKRTVNRPPPTLPEDVTAEEISRADDAWHRAGYRKRSA